MGVGGDPAKLKRHCILQHSLKSLPRARPGSTEISRAERVRCKSRVWFHLWINTKKHNPTAAFSKSDFPCGRLLFLFNITLNKKTHTFVTLFKVLRVVVARGPADAHEHRETTRHLPSGSRRTQKKVTLPPNGTNVLGCHHSMPTRETF